MRVFDEAFYTSAVSSALVAFGVDPGAHVTLIKHRENAVFKVESDGQKAVLRMHRPGYRTIAQLRSEAAWTSDLRGASVPTPAHFLGRDGEAIQIVTTANDISLFVDLLEWVDGAPSSEDELVPTFMEVGRLSALIHEHSKIWQRPIGFDRPSLDQNSLFGKSGVWGDFAKLARASAQQQQLFALLADAVRVDLSGFAKTRETWGLIHGDLMPENILKSSIGTIVIDFDDGGESWFVGDLATSLGMYLGTEMFEPLMAAWLEGYASVADPEAIGLERLPTLIGARLLQGLGWMHTRRDSEVAQQMTPFVIGATVAFAEDYLSG